MGLLKKRNIRRAGKIVDMFEGQIKEGQSVIDIGMGNGLIASIVKKRFKADVIGADVIDYNESDITMKIFDGKNLPFKDNEFDVAIIIETLHHCDDPIQILREAKRVAKKVIILEDVHVSRIHKMIMNFYDFMMNVRHGVNTPFNFRSHKEWMGIFERLGLKVMKTVWYRNNPIYSPMKTRFYVMGK